MILVLYAKVKTRRAGQWMKSWKGTEAHRLLAEQRFHGRMSTYRDQELEHLDCDLVLCRRLDM